MAALEHLRCLPHLRSLRLWLDRGALEVAFPPFIPPSLKELDLNITDGTVFESLLRELPSMLQASGASLEAIELSSLGEVRAECGAAIAQVFRTCSSTLKTVKMILYWGPFPGAVCFRELALGLTSCCHTLEVLHCPWEVFSALPATCPSFARLGNLTLSGAGEAIDLASPAWDTMANGRLPALADLYVWASHDFKLTRVDEREGAGEGQGRFSCALGAVAGTLKKLSLGRTSKEVVPAEVCHEVCTAIGKLPRLRNLSLYLGNGLPAGASYELGAAIGNLRRLRCLILHLFDGGRDYQAMGQGMAASGGCPELFKVRLAGVSENIDRLTYEPSVIAPSVRELEFEGGRGSEDEALLLCCGLVQMGYKHRLRNWPSSYNAMPGPLQLKPVCGPFFVGVALTPIGSERPCSLSKTCRVSQAWL
jgi:hypothetical protein